jgi:protein TonB
VKKITHKRRKKQEKPQNMDEKPIHFQKQDSIPVEEKEILQKEDNVFLPDMADIPMAFPTAKEEDTEINHPEKPPSHTPAAPIIEAVPMYKKNSPPLYPELARKRGYQGKVVLEVLVKKDGHAGAVRLITSSGYKILDKTAMEGVRKWLFHPGKKGDELVEMWVKIPVRFMLK